MAESKMATTENHNPASDPQADERLAKLRGEQPADAPAPSTQGRPTPTQEEMDRLVLGEHVVLEPDGSPPQPQHGAVAVDRKDRLRRRDESVATEPPPEPIPTQAQVDAIARGDHLRSPKGGPALPEGAVVPEGMQHIPPEDRREKAGEPDGDKAAYKTREAHADKRGSKKSEEDKK